MKKATIEIIDHGGGNCGPLKSALVKAGFRVAVRGEIGRLGSANALVIPGVGNFGAGIKNLRKRGLDVFVRDWAASGLPLLGICLGMQMFFTSSEEYPDEPGLGLINGSVVALEHGSFHIGWNRTNFLSNSALNADYFYNHSFHVETSEENVTSLVQFNGQRLVSSVRSGNIFGFQFHPEKSQDAGELLLKSILEEGLSA